MKKFILGVILAGLTSFFWGAFYWMGPITANTFKTQEDDSALRQALLDNMRESGTYYVPNTGNNEESMKLMEQGPVALIHFIREGRSDNMAPSIVLGLLLNIFTALIIALLLKIALNKLNRYNRRIGFVALIGFVAAFYTHMSSAIWWYHAATWTIIQFLYDFTVYVVSGLVLAAFIKPE
ncbi:hypothetical protein JXQ31_07185 [candidate division KSB1 bacterium]|nr:hypothetical protein [candidate division KSB1 bacterium]